MSDEHPGDEFYQGVKAFRAMLESAGVDVEGRQINVIMPMEDMRRLIAHFGMEKTRGIFEALRIQFRGIGQ